MSKFKSLCVGASDDADIVIRQPTVSKIHCRFDWNSQYWTLTDLQSTNGTFVNGQRISQPTKLADTDRITLGRGVACEIPKTPATQFVQANADSTISKHTASSKASARGPHYKSLLPIGFAIPAVGLMGIVFLWSRSGDSGLADQSASSDATTVVDSEGPQNKEKAPAKEAREESQVAKEKLPATHAESSPIVFAVLVQSADEKVSKLLGTGVAIDSHKIATLASVIDAVEAVRDEYPRMVLVASDDAKRSLIPIKTFKNPNYLTAMSEFSKFEKDLKAKLDAVESLEEPSLDDRLKWSDRFDALMESIASSDVAILEVKETLDTNSPNKRLAAVTGSVRLVGFPLISPAPEIESNLSAFRIELLGKLASGDNQLSNTLEIETTGVLALSTVTLACVTESGQLIGLVVRQVSSETSNLKRLSLVIPINQILQVTHQQ